VRPIFEQQLDLARSKEEIPLLDHAGGATRYGIDSLLYILGQRWAWVPAVARLRPVDWFLRRLYRLVSYNRRVIVANNTPAGAFDCAPPFHLFYRVLYLLLALAVGGGLLGWFAEKYFPPLLALAVLVGAMAILLPALRRPSPDAVHYLGIMATPLLVAGLLVLPALWWPLLAWPLAGLALVVGGSMVGRRWDSLIKSNR